MKYNDLGNCYPQVILKDASSRPATLLKNRLQRRCFPANFEKFLRTLFLQNIAKCQVRVRDRKDRDLTGASYIILKEVPVVFHNGSNCDYHFIITELTKNFGGKFSCIEEKKEK